MARLERVGDRTELVTDDGIRLPWVLDERPEYGLTLPPLGPDLRTASNAHAAPKREETRSDFNPLAAMQAVDEAETRDALTKHISRSQPAQSHSAPAAKRTESGIRPDGEFTRSEEKPKGDLRGGARMVDAPDIGDEPSEQAPRRTPVQRIPGGLRTESLQITRGSGGTEDVAGLRQASERSSISNREALAAQGVSEITERASQAEELGMQAEGLSEKLQKTRVQNAKAQLEHDSRIAELDNEREKLLNLESDPYHFWASKGAGTKILAAIGMLGAGLLAGVRGGENQFMKLVQQTMAEDKADRLARIKARQRGLQIRRDANDKLGEALDADLAEQETTGRQLAAVTAQLRGYARTVQTSNAALAAKVNAEADKYDLLARKEFADVNSKVGDRIVETIKNVPDQFVGGTPVVKESDVQAYGAARSKEGLAESESSAGNIRDLISEVPAEGEIPTEESRNVLSRAYRGALDFVGGRGTAQSFDSPEERAAAAKLGRVKSAIISRLSGANVPPQEYERLAEGINETNTREGLERYANEVERAIQRKDAAVGAGFKPEVVETYKERQKGLAPRARPKSSRAE